MEMCLEEYDNPEQPLLDEYENYKEPNTHRFQRRYVIVTMGFLIHLINGAVFLTGGVLVPEFLASFPDASESSVTSIVSIILGVSSIAGK